jgi:crossover junction endodeoxyribonuclease RuvC
MRILGVDPGASVTGFGVIERLGAGRRGFVHVTHGTLRTPRGADLPQKLEFIRSRLCEVVAEHAPEVAMVERVFVAANIRSALVLGQARGVVLAALASGGVAVEEISAREVKKAVTGNGDAGKGQVKQMVARLLALDIEPPSDAADALALALYRAQSGRLAGLDVRTRSRPRSRRDLAALVARAEARSR